MFAAYEFMVLSGYHLEVGFSSGILLQFTVEV
jgi:hypothetical protein